MVLRVCHLVHLVSVLLVRVERLLYMCDSRHLAAFEAKAPAIHDLRAYADG